MREVSNTDDVIDSRDVIARIEELEEEAQDAAEHIAECEAELAVIEAKEETTLADEDRACALRQAIEYSRFSEDDAEELRVLKALAEEAEGCAADWHHGETLIRDSYFEDYARELAEDIGVIPDTSAWPGRCIDWEQAARELQQDYTSVDFDGVTYWVR